MLTKIYLETTNVCNLSCSFCHGTKRPKSFMSYENFRRILPKIKGKSKHLYFHLMGEPLLNRDLPKMVHDAKAEGFEVMLTTNGTLLSERGNFIFESGDVKKVSVSLQSADIIDGKPCADFSENLDGYLKNVSDFAINCGKNGVICSLRLWNIEKEDDTKNDFLIEKLHTFFPDKWLESRSGYKLFNTPKGEMPVFLEFGELFTWPDEKAEEKDVTFCHAIRDQVGILCDGTVVPCCLDADGVMALGNIYEKDFDEIINCERALKILKSFNERRPCEKLCKTCGYAKRF